MSEAAASSAIRLDKWLWAARFFKTRSLASQAIEGGHVHVNDQRAKPARAVRLGDVLRIRNPGGEFVVTVAGLSEQRGPASVAQGLYVESPESIAARQLRREQIALAPSFDHADIKGRPTKKWRRQLHAFERKQDD